MVRALWAQSHTREEKSPLIRAEQSEIRADKENRLCQTAQTGEVQFWQSVKISNGNRDRKLIASSNLTP